MKGLYYTWLRMAGAAMLSGLVLMTATRGTADQTNNYWTGSVGNGLWSDAGNWSENVIPDTNHIVRLGATNCPNAAVDITLDVPTATVYQVFFDCISNRYVTLDGVVGETTNVLQPVYHTTYMISYSAGADTGALINCGVWYDIDTSRGWHEFRGNGTLTFGPDYTYTTSRASFESRNFGATVRFAGSRINRSWRERNACTIQVGGNAYFSAWGFDNPASILIDSSAYAANWTARAYVATGGQVHTIQRVGPGERTLTTKLTVATSSNVPNYDWTSNNVEVIENTIDEGHLTLRIDYWRILTYKVVTDADTTVELFNNGDRLMEFGVEPGIAGPGNVHLKMDNPAQAFTLRRPLGHTGATLLYTGILSVASHTVTTNDARTASDYYPEGVYWAAVSPESSMFVGADASLDLNGQTNTVKGLSGVGTIVLDGGKLISTSGVSPGDSVGVMPIAGSGTLELSGGTSTFEINATNDYDRVVLGDADLILDGTLNVVVNGPMTHDLYGDYTIFTLTNGTASGMFTDFEDNFNGFASARIVDDDVILTLNEPQGTAIIIR